MDDRELRIKLQGRLRDILARFILADDAERTDVEFAGLVYQRFLQSRNDLLIDPNE